MKKWRRKENASLTRIGEAWIAKLPDNGMAQCNLCATHFSISCGGRTDVRRHKESARHAKLAKSKGLYEGWGGPVAYVVHGQNEVRRRCNKRGNNVRILDRTSQPSHVPHSNTTLSTVLLSEEASCKCDYKLIRYFPAYMFSAEHVT